MRATIAHNNEHWTDKFPGDDPPDAYLSANHLLDVTAKPSCTYTRTYTQQFFRK